MKQKKLTPQKIVKTIWINPITQEEFPSYAEAADSIVSAAMREELLEFFESNGFYSSAIEDMVGELSLKAYSDLYGILGKYVDAPI